MTTPDLWTEATRDVEAEKDQRRVAYVTQAASEVWPFLAAAQSPQEYAARKAMAAERIEAAVETVAERGTGAFERLHASLVTALDADFETLHNSPERVAARTAAEAQRASQLIGAELMRQASKTSAEMVRDHELAPLQAEWQEAFAALKAAGLEADADHPVAKRYRDASNAVNHAHRSRDFNIATGQPTAAKTASTWHPITDTNGNHRLDDPESSGTFVDDKGIIHNGVSWAEAQQRDPNVKRSSGDIPTTVDKTSKTAGEYGGGSPKSGDKATCHKDDLPIQFFDGQWMHLSGGPSHNDVYPATPRERAEKGKTAANTYVCMWRGKRAEVEAETTYEAQKKAAAQFGAKKTFEVDVMLAQKDGKDVVHDPARLGALIDAITDEDIDAVLSGKVGRGRNDFSLSDAKNEAGEWIMSPEQIRAEQNADQDADYDEEPYDDDYAGGFQPPPRRRRGSRHPFDLDDGLFVFAVAWGRRHYEDLAEFISTQDDREQLAKHFGAHLEGTSPNYRRDQFEKAASTPGYRVRGGTGTANYTTGHFRHIADGIKSYPGDKNQMAEAFADHLFSKNPRFKRDTFLKATQGGKSNPYGTCPKCGSGKYRKDFKTCTQCGYKGKTSARDIHDLRRDVGDAMKRYLHPDYHADGQATLDRTHDAVLDHLADMYGWTIEDAQSAKEHHDKVADAVAAHVYETAPFTEHAPPRHHTAAGGGSGWGAHKIGEPVRHIHEVNEGDLLAEDNKQFGAKNLLRVTHVDHDRGLLHGHFVDPADPTKKRMADDHDLAVWDFDLAQGNHRKVGANNLMPENMYVCPYCDMSGTRQEVGKHISDAGPKHQERGTVTDQFNERIRHGGSLHTAEEHGGYHLEQGDGGWYVVNHIGERKNNEPMTHDKALKYQRALMVNVPGAKEDAERHEKNSSRTAAVERTTVGDMKKGDEVRIGGEGGAWLRIHDVDHDRFPDHPTHSHFTFSNPGWTSEPEGTTDEHVMRKDEPIERRNGHSAALHPDKESGEHISAFAIATGDWADWGAQFTVLAINEAEVAQFRRTAHDVWDERPDIEGTSDVCPDCNGTGQVPSLSPHDDPDNSGLQTCPTCHGTGIDPGTGMTGGDHRLSHLTRSADGPARPAGDSRHFHLIQPSGGKWHIYRVPRSQVGQGKARNKVKVSTHDTHEEAVRALNTLKGKTAAESIGKAEKATCVRCGAAISRPAGEDRWYGDGTASNTCGDSDSTKAGVHMPKPGTRREAVNTDAAGADRYQRTPTPARPAWVTHWSDDDARLTEAEHNQGRAMSPGSNPMPSQTERPTDSQWVYQPVAARKIGWMDFQAAQQMLGQLDGHPVALTYDDDYGITTTAGTLTYGGRSVTVTSANGKTVTVPVQHVLNVSATGFGDTRDPAEGHREPGAMDYLMHGNFPSGAMATRHTANPTPVFTEDDLGPDHYTHLGNDVWGIRCPHCGEAIKGNGTGGAASERAVHITRNHGVVEATRHTANPYSPNLNPYTTDGPGHPDQGGTPGDAGNGLDDSGGGDMGGGVATTTRPRVKPNTDYTDGSGGDQPAGFSMQQTPSTSMDNLHSQNTSAPWRAAASLREVEEWYASPARQKVAAKAKAIADDIQTTNPGMGRGQALGFAVQTIRAFPRTVGGIAPSALGGVLDRYLTELSQA